MYTQQPTKEPLPGDYYGTIYKGSMIGFVLAVAMVITLIGVVIWLVVRRVRNERK